MIAASERTAAETSRPSMSVLRDYVAQYEAPNHVRAWMAFVTSLPPFVACCWLMYQLLDVSYPLVLFLAFPAAGFLVRTFIVQHDCGHGTFFRSRLLRNIVGRICAPITLLPYGYFRHFHGAHHAHSGKLHERGSDIETLTVREYHARSAWKRAQYRVMRHPLFLFGIGPFAYFVLYMRLPWIAPGSWKRERRSILATNVAIALIAAAVISQVGLGAFVRVQLPVTLIASTVGMWLFYVQHQFEDTYWARDGEWDFRLAALQGSSFYELPPVLAWFTGYIGYHHVHHLSPRVPCYALVACHRGNEVFSSVPRITLGDSIRCARLALWDEEQGRLVSFSHAQSLVNEESTRERRPHIEELN